MTTISGERLLGNSGLNGAIWLLFMEIEPTINEPYGKWSYDYACKLVEEYPEKWREFQFLSRIGVIPTSYAEYQKQLGEEKEKSNANQD